MLGCNSVPATAAPGVDSSYRLEMGNDCIFLIAVVRRAQSGHNNKFSLGDVVLL